MSGTAAASSSAPVVRKYRWPRTLIARFTARRTLLMAAIWALIFGIFVASKAIGYAKAYPTVVERNLITQSIGNNIGMKVILGTPHQLQTVAGFAAWNTGSVMALIGAVWAFLLATKTFRGEEAAGRWELLLAGQTTARRAALNALIGLGAGLAVFYAVLAVALVGIGQVHTVDYSASAGMFLALTTVLNAAVFLMVGAVASQLMPTRSRASGAAALVFGVCFLLRAMASTTTMRWLLDLSPLGWAERAQPLFATRAIWIVPSLATILLLGVATVWLAGRRDLGASFFADRDTARPRLGLLNGPIGLTVRLTRAASIGWLTAITMVAVYFGLMTKSATDAFHDTARSGQALDKLTHAAGGTGLANVFLSIVFMLVMILIMAYAANSVSATREEEANGYLDNLLVRPLGRLRWLLGRVGVVAVNIIAVGLLSGMAVWVGLARQHLGVDVHTLFIAGANTVAPALLVIGIGVFAAGFVPRYTSLISYGVIAWAFLVQMVSSGINLNHWILDTSIFTHVSLAPAANPDWGKNVALLLIGAGLCAAGAWMFNRRDLQSE